MLSANGPAGGRSGGGLRLAPGPESGGLVRDDAVYIGFGQAGPVCGGVGRPGPELQPMVTRGVRGVRPDNGVEEGDGAYSLLDRAGTERLQAGAAHRRDDEGCFDLRGKGAGALHEVVVERVERSP